MADKAKDTLGDVAGNAPGGRGLGDVGDTLGSLTTRGPKEKKKKGPKKNDATDEEEEEVEEGFGLDGKDVKGSLKVHIKLDLEADIRIIARIKGDIAIGLL